MPSHVYLYVPAGLKGAEIYNWENWTMIEGTTAGFEVAQYKQGFYERHFLPLI